MTASAQPEPLEPSQPIDPHESKISPDDPRLRLGRARGRTLRAGPIVAIVIASLGLVAVALVISLQPASTAGHSAEKTAPETPPGPPQPPVIPAELLRGHHRRLPAQDAGAPQGPRAAAFGQAKRSDREEQQQKAATAGLLFEAHADAPPQAPPPATTAAVATQPQQPPQARGDSDPNLQEHKNSFVDSQTTKTSDTLLATVHHPVSPYEIQAGTIIPAVLITAINSDLPGPVIGQVRENVYDTVTGNYLLVPQGARLMATYDSMVVWGQERVLMCWNRLIFPNGDSIPLQCMPAADLAGAAGLTDDVNEHWWRILKGAAIASLLAATAQGVAGNQGSTGYSPSVPQMWAQNGSASVSQVGQSITKRNLDIQPTITVRPGWSLNVIVTKDMVLSPYSMSPSPIPMPVGR